MEIRLKHLTSISNPYPIGDGDHGQIKPEQYLDEGIPYIRVQNLSFSDKIDFEGMVYISQEVNRANAKSILHPGDILVAKTGATIGKAGVIPESIPIANTTSSVGKITIDTKRALPKFIYYCIASDPLQMKMWEIASTKSAQPGFNIEDIKEFKVCLFPLDEQKKIIAFLDKKIFAIDNLIEKENVAIKNLLETKKSLISTGTSEGEIIKLKYISTLVTGSTPESSKSRYWDGDISWITPADMIDGKEISTGQRSITREGLNSCSTKLIPVSSIVMSTRAPIGTVAITSKELCFNQGCKALIVKKSINPRYVFYSLMANSDSLKNLGKGTTFMELSSSDFANYKIKIPSVEKQNEVVTELDNKCSAIDKLIDLKTTKIEKLKEYKKSLIYECVTGRREI